METVIKNIHKIVEYLSPDSLEKLEHGALQYRKYAKITFKIVSWAHTDDIKTITIEVRQDRSPAENYLDDKGLYERGRDLFKPFFPEDTRFYFNTVPFVESPTEKVTPEYIRHFMTEYGVRVKDVAAETGLDKTNISAWMNGAREMSQIVKAMFYYYFQHVQIVKTIRQET